MAENNLTTYITANADFSSLRAQLAAVTAQLIKLQETTVGTNAKLGNQIAVMNKAFAETMRSTGQFSTHFVSLTDDVSKFGKNLDSGRLKLNDYYNAWNGHTKKTSSLIKDLAKQQVMLEQAIVQPLGKNAQGLMQYNVQVARGLDEIKNKTAIARQEAAIMNKVMLDGSNQLINWGKNTQWAGRQLTVGLTVPLAAFGMAAQKAFREADAELVRLQKVYGGLTATSATELAKVRKDVSDTAREIAGSYGVAYKDTIALAADLAATGKQGNDLIKATQQTTRLAVLGEVDRQDAMKATLAIQNAFKQNTDELTKSIDFLNAVENQTSTSLQDLTEAIPKAGPVIKSLGGDVKDLALYLTAMKEGGVNAAEGANAIKSAMASLINPTKVAKEMFTGFGINLEGIVTSNAGNLTQTILDLQSALDMLDPLSKSRAIEQLFGKFQYARMSALFENLGKSGSQTLQVMDLMKASASDLANISSRELTMMTESASGKYKRALASVQADLAQVGNQFLTISTYVLRTIDGVVKFFDKLPAPLKSVLAIVGGLTAIAGPMIMLAGVLGNFVGYVIKGVFHLRQLVKGGQGFKLLTPEIIAAMEAGKGLSTTFYSDEQATLALANAVDTLTASFNNLELKAASAKVSVGPAISTLANNVLMPGQAGERVVNKDSKYVGKPYTRQMAHLIPAGMEQPGTIFGVVPNPGPVNVRVGKNPQAYMNSDLQKIPGVTSVNGVSTGIVAQEAAKWHAMTGALAMQSEAELKVLKTEVTATGTITASLAQSYEALLPQFTEITTLAAQETTAIVAELNASKITVDQARAKVIALNLQIETMLAETTAATAAGMGRTANLTTVPLTGQPTVDPITGKSNMKELFHKSPTQKLIDRIALSLGNVRTSGGGYSIETTKPKFNLGGDIERFGSNNTRVSGPSSITYDDRVGKVPVGGYVLNQSASLDPKNKPIVDAAPTTFAGGGKVIDALLTPKETVYGPDIQKNPSLYAAVQAANNGTPLPQQNIGGRITARQKNYGTLNIGKLIGRMSTTRNRDIIESIFGIRARGSEARGFISQIDNISDPILKQKYLDETAAFANKLTRSRKDPKFYSQTARTVQARHINDLNDYYASKGLDPLSYSDPRHDTHLTVSKLLGKGKALISDYVVDYTATSNLQANNNRLRPSDFIKRDLVNVPGINKYRKQLKAAGIPKSQWEEAETLIDNAIKNRFTAEADKLGVPLSELPFIGDRPDKGAAFTFTKDVIPAIESVLTSLNPFATHRQQYKALKENTKLRSRGLNSGGPVGGLIKVGKGSYGFQLPASVIERLTARWEPPRQFYKPGFQYKLGNQDPLHGPLQIGMSNNLKRYGSYKPNDFESRQQVVFKDDQFSRLNIMDAFLTGTAENRGKYATSQYMSGNLNLMGQMEALGNHPLGPIAAMKTLQKKFTGKLYRGLIMGKTHNSLPEKLIEDIRMARATGDYSNIIGQEFIMRRSSWSKNQRVGTAFAPGYGVNADSILLEAKVRNRNILPAGDMFPEKVFQAPYGQSWNKTRFGSGAMSEEEAIFGGKFKIVGFDNGKMQVETVVDGARENGGNVNSGRPYLVGEKGPEIFVPKNSGGIIPNYALGGNILANKNHYGQLPTVKGTIAKQMLPMAGFMLLPPMLEKLGVATGKVTTAMNVLFAGLMIKQMASIPKQVAAARAAAGAGSAVEGAVAGGAAGKAGGIMSRFSSGGIKNAIFGVSKLNVTLAALTVAAGVAYSVWDKHQQKLKLNALGYGLTEEAAKKAGLTFKNYNKTIADTIEQSQMLRDKNHALYQNIASSGTPLNLTISEYRKLRKEVQSTYADQIKLINATNSKDVGSLATRLKVEFMAAGMSAEEATKKIYAMIAASNKQSQSALATVGNKSFTDIASGKDVGVAGVQNFDTASTLGTTQDQIAALNTALQGIDQAIKSTVDEARKAAIATGKSFNEEAATAKATADEIAKIGDKHQKVSIDLINELAKTNPSIRQFASTQDTVLDLWKKIRIEASGFTGDLSALNSKQIDALYKMEVLISKSVTAATAGGILKSQNDKLNQLYKTQQKYLTASKGQSVQQQISARDKLTALQKEIDANNKLADARLKALDVAKTEADLANEIAKKKAEYAAAIATGNTAQAEQSSLDIQKLQSDMQYNSQRKAIEDSRDAKNAPIQAQIDKLNAAQQKLADSAALAGTGLDKATKAYQDQKDKVDAVNSAMGRLKAALLTTTQPIEQFKKGQEYQDLLSAVKDALTGAGYSVPKGTDPLKWAEAMFDKMDQAIITADSVVINALASKITNGKNTADTSPSAVKANDAKQPVGSIVPVKDDKGKTVGVTTVKAGDANAQNPALPKSPPKGMNQYHWNQYTAGQIVKMQGEVKPGLNKGADGNYYEFDPSLSKPGFVYDKTGKKVIGWWSNFDATGITQRAYGSGGQVNNYDDGGNVRGPGTGTSDSIPAYLSNGEYVIRAAAVNQYGKDFFDGLNAQKFGKGGEAKQSFWDRLIHGDKSPVMFKDPKTGKMIEGKMLKGEVPFGPGGVAKVASKMAQFTAEMKSFHMADIDAKAMNALSKMDLSALSIPKTGISFSPESAGMALEGLKNGRMPASVWEIVQSQRESLLKNKYPKVDLSNVSKFNEHYAKEFYDLLPDDAIKLFKGVRNTTGDAWRTGKDQLGTYFSTNPHIAATYSALIGSAKIGEELPMFSINKKIAELKNFLGEGAIRNGSAQGSMEFPQVLGGESLSKMLPKVYSLPGQVYGQIFGATGNSLKSIKNLWPNGFAEGGMAAPSYSVPSSSPSIPNAAAIGYNRGASHHYEVGGLVVNAAPGQSERQIASMVVDMLNQKSIKDSAMLGGSKNVSIR